MLSLVSLLSVRIRGGGVSSVRLLSCPAPRLPASADHVIVGGGVAGASTAYHLARRGAGSETLLLEAAQLTSGTTWHSAAMINSLRGDVVDGLLFRHTKDLVSDLLERDTGVSTGFKRHGGLTVTSNPEMMTQFERERDVATYTGNSAVLLSPSQCRDKFPGLDVTGLLGGIGVASVCTLNRICEQRVNIMPHHTHNTGYVGTNRGVA